MRTKSFILTFLMMMFCSVSFGQNTNPDWGEFNYHDYAMNMEVIAKISLDGEAQTSTSIQVAAYCGNERRSEVVNVKSTPGGSLVQLQVFGVKGFPTDPDQTQTTEKITFKFYDGTSMFVSNEDMDFKGNHVVGDLFNPFTIEFKSVAKIGDVKYGSLQAAINAAQASDVIVLLADVVAETNPVNIPADVTLDLNTHTIKADIFGTVRTNNGLWITSDGYKMIGKDADIYASDDATVVNTLVNNVNTITIAAGNVTLAATQYNEWWTAQGQELIIGESVTFTIPQGKKFNIESNTSVTINGTVSNEGTLAIKNDATVKGNITGDIHFLGGKYITADNYKMVGTTSDYYYNTTNALVNIAGQFGDITIKSGEMTLGKSWRTVQGQTLTIASGATFTVPANMTFEVFKNTHVIVNGTLVTDGTVYLQLNATVEAAEGLNVTTNVADHKVVYEGGVYKVVAKVYIAQTETGAKYETLQEAVNAGTTVTLLQPATGAGVVIDKDITIDFGGNTYTVNQAVGSAGTETLGFQILKNNIVTLMNGTLTSAAAVEGSNEIKMLIQNYADLTLTNMNLVDNTDHISYALSNNSGNVKLDGNTNITTDKVAFDVYDYTAGGYAYPVVNVNTTGTISGKIEVSESISNNLNIKDGSFTNPIAEAWCAVGYIPTTEVVGETTYYTVKVGEYVAQVNDGAKYESLVEAYDAAQSGATVKLLKDATGAGLKINKDITVDFGGKTYTINQAVGSSGTESQGFQLLKEATEVTLQNGTVEVKDGAHVVWMINDYSAKLNVTSVIFNCEHMDLPNNGDASNVYFLVANNAHNQNPAVTLTDVEVNNFGSDFGSPYFMEPNTTIKSADANLDIEVDPGYRLVYDATQQTYSVEKLIAHFDGGAYARFAANKPREHFSITLQDVYASESLVVKVYHDETLLLTTTYRAEDLDAPGVNRYPVSAERLTVNNVVSGKVAGSWLNEYMFENVYSGNKHFAVNNVPNKFKVYVDGILTDTYDGTQNPNAGFSSAENLKTYLGFDGVYKAASVTRGEDVTYYMTLAEAFAAATQNGDIVTLYDNVELTARLNVANNITLNLNNKNITANFEDSYGAIYVKKGAELTIGGEGGITSNNSVAIGTYGTVNIKGGNITSGEGYAALYMFYYQNDYEGTANISGGSLNTVWNCGTLNVSGGQIDYLDTSSELNVTGGVITKMLAKDGSDASGAYEMNIQNIETTVPTVEVPADYKFVEIRENVYQVVAKNYVAQTETGAKFETLKEAIDAANETVTLLQTATGAGVVINKDITIDFGGYTYLFNEGVGSTGTESNGFQILQGNIVVLKNGGLNVAETAKANFYILVQNYTNLTVENMTLDGTNLDKWSKVQDNWDSYTLSNNSGEVNIINTKIYANDEGVNAFAFDVDNNANYTSKPVVNVSGENTLVRGNVEVDLPDNLNISGGTFTVEVEEAWCADGFIPVKNADNTWTVKEGKFIAQTETGDKFETLQEAVNAGTTVTLLDDATGAGVVINKDITIDFNGKTYTVNQAVGSSGTETLGFQILKDNDVTLMNGTLTSTTPVVSGKEVKMLIQNYANLTLTDMNLVDNTDHILYALSNNSGNVNLDGNTNITTDKVAFDVCKYASYTEPIVNVNTTGVIAGDIEVTTTQQTNLNISGGTFTVEIEEAWCANGFIPVKNADNTWTVKVGKYVARNTTTGQGYETLRAAVETANAGETITLLQDITLEGGYVDATEGLRIELKGEDYADDKYLTIDGNGKTINCGNYEKGIRIYNESSKRRRLDINNVTIVNNNTNGRCIDTRSGMINLKINNSELTATNGNSQPLTIGGNDEIHRVMLGNTKINAGNSGYGVICFVSTHVDIQTAGNTQIDGYAAFYIKGDDKTVNLNLGQGVYTGKNVHSGESNNFGAVVLEGDKVSVNLYGTNPTVKAIAEGTAPQTAFLVLGENNTITIKSETTQVVTEGDNAYWAMIDADIASSTTIRYGKEIANNQYEYTPILPAAEARGFQFMSLEEAIRFANAEETVTIVNDNTMTATVVVEKNLTIDLNNKTVSYSSTAASPAIRVLADVTVKNGTIKTTNAEGNNYCFIVGQGEKAGKLTIENGLYDASLGGTSVASVTNGELNIKGGEFISKEYNGDHRFLINCIDGNYINNTAKVSIIGGTFHKFNPENNLAEGADTNFCPEGYIAIYDAVNDTYTVKEGVWRAQIGDVKYETVSAAVKAAVDGNVIELLGDVTENFTVGYEATDIKKITIDLKQHTLSSSDLTITINRTGTELTLVNGTVTGNSTGGTIRPTGGGKLILGDDVIVKSGGQAKAIYLHNGHFIVEKDKNVKVYGGIGFLDADNNNNNNEPTVNYISIASGYYQGAIEINDESTCILTGGTYTQDVNEWCADGYVSQNNGDGTWTVRVANYVAAIGETKYESLKAAIDAAQDGNTITVITSHELAETVIVNKNVNIDFATGVELTTKVYPTAFRITEGADVTVVNANIKTVEGGLYNFILGASDSSSEGNLTIKNGTFVANTTVASVTKGNLVIEGGDFSLVEGTTDYRYLINCIDANYNNETATVAISGGTFHNWNPQDNAAETGGHANFCAEGYAAVETSTGVWEVVPMQEMKLYAGWNWFSSYIDINGEAGLGRLQEALNPHGAQIKNDGGFTQYTEGQGWFGPTLESASVKEMYMINMSADHELQLKGELVDPAQDENAITLVHGWNWIGYQLNIGLNLENALAGFNPNHGDRIKSHQGFSQYYNNELYEGWWGTLETMTPGYGYMYYNANENDATLKYSYPADGSKSEVRANITSENNYWVPASSRYAGNMNIVAMLEADGDNYEIAAFVGGEVRGSARPIYVEPLDAYMFFLTVHGEDVEEMTFKVYDLATGEEYDLNDRMNYSDNAVVGSIEEPYIFRGTVGVGETSLGEINVYPNPTTIGNEINLGTVCDTVEVFNALGVKVAEYQNVDSVDALETAGIYVIRITNNGNVQNCRLIVK